MERLEDFILRLSEMGFDVNDSREAWQNGIFIVQDAIDWYYDNFSTGCVIYTLKCLNRILAGKPKKIQTSAPATLKLGQSRGSGSLNEECNPFSDSVARPLLNAEDTSKHVDKMDSEELVESRMHLNDEQRKIRERFEEKQRQEARKKIVEEKRNKRLVSV